MNTTYPSDLSETEWQCLQQYLRDSRSDCRTRRHSLRSILNAIFYIPRAGCPWRGMKRFGFEFASRLVDVDLLAAKVHLGIVEGVGGILMDVNAHAQHTGIEVGRHLHIARGEDDMVQSLNLRALLPLY